jgi:hypothetical protein
MDPAFFFARTVEGLPRRGARFSICRVPNPLELFRMRRIDRLTAIALGLALALAAPASMAKGPVAPWLAGAWCGGEDDELVEETWASEAGGEAIGMSRTLRGGRIETFEFLRIIDRMGVPTLVAQPNGEPPTFFPRTGGGEDWIRFENKEHDYPQRIEYRKDGDGLLAQIGGPGAEGKEETISYRYTRCPAAPVAAPENPAD